MVSKSTSKVESFRSSRKGSTMENLRIKCIAVLKEVENLLKELEKHKNEQFALDFIDKLNELSIRF